MRIRRSASRLLGSAYLHLWPHLLSSPPPPYLVPCSELLGFHSAGGFSISTTGFEERCELNCSPWDLVDDLSLFDAQVVDDLLDSYFVDVEYRWHCRQPVSHPNSLCKYHIRQKRCYFNPEFALAMEEEKAVSASSSKTSGSSKIRKKKPTNDFNATEGFYYYARFGRLLHGKRNRRSTTHDTEPLPPKQEEVEVEPPKYASPRSHVKVETDDGDNNNVLAHDFITSIHEESNDDDYDQGSS
ncbi:hypothetical protein BAE44_0023591 [Dichanthelium oligosanthes]|uniref:WRC domain-containing protein n=1 Tax=Dichanthelium oligosanthes TaxID=888268 RepID=A0A1E5URB1_9POAL|nr:hypothetical protein BAE44_0023591 [Dichanthelium oligosanthes]